MHQQNFNIKTTKIAVIVLLVISCYMSIRGVYLARHFLARISDVYVTDEMAFPLLLVLGYCAAFSLIYMLFHMYLFLTKLEKDLIFTHENVILLRCIERGCELGSLFSFGMGILYSYSILIIAFAALFMSLLIRIIRNAFDKAAVMKDELDLTI